MVEENLRRMKTRDKILLKAQELFNKKGLAQVSVRNICEELGISLGNYTYYFPDKQQIVVELYQKMVVELEDVIVPEKISKDSVLYLLHYHKKIFGIQTNYKFFFLNTFELIHNNAQIRKAYLIHLENEKKRKVLFIKTYLENGVLRPGVTWEMFDKMVNVSLMVSHFWMIDAELRYPGKEKQKLIYFLELCCSLLEPHLSMPALKEFNEFFKKAKKV